ncbi:head-tail connector protein [Novosphingobium sp. 9]|uniref:head-tail connector protein n=1 Tax=Novosphingobium sp. 9 TaxID=2025349 RepID=UPI0021B64B0C|nr:head-tail connector protein [Novosphingobium sp. 9]
MAIDLSTAKQHLRVDASEEDALIGVYLLAAQGWVESYTDKTLADFDPVPGVLDAAVLLLVGDFYANREAGAATPAITAAVEALCDPYRAVQV